MELLPGEINEIRGPTHNSIQLADTCRLSVVILNYTTKIWTSRYRGANRHWNIFALQCRRSCSIGVGKVISKLCGEEIGMISGKRSGKGEYCLRQDSREVRGFQGVVTIFRIGCCLWKKATWSFGSNQMQPMPAELLVRGLTLDLAMIDSHLDPSISINNYYVE